jgi:hypothetical protein
MVHSGLATYAATGCYTYAGPVFQLLPAAAHEAADHHHHVTN